MQVHRTGSDRYRLAPPSASDIGGSDRTETYADGGDRNGLAAVEGSQEVGEEVGQSEDANASLIKYGF